MTCKDKRTLRRRWAYLLKVADAIAENHEILERGDIPRGGIMTLTTSSHIFKQTHLDGVREAECDIFGFLYCYKPARKLHKFRKFYENDPWWDEFPGTQAILLRCTYEVLAEFFGITLTDYLYLTLDTRPHVVRERAREIAERLGVER